MSAAPSSPPAPPAQRTPATPGRTMLLAAMRWVDNWVGLPLCFVFGLLALVARRIWPARPRKVTGTRPIAVFKFFGLGSIMEATPLLRAIRQRHPQAPLVFVTFDAMAPLLQRLGLATHLRVLRTGSPVRLAMDCLRAVLWMRRIRVEAVVDLEFFSKFSTLLSFLSGARLRVGYHLNEFWRRSLVKHPIYFNYFHHITDIFCEAGRRLDVELTDHRISRLEPPPEALVAATNSLRSAGWKEGAPLLGVNVNAGELCHERRWPIERFAWVVERLLRDRPGLFLAVTGAPSEKAYSALLLEALPADLRPRAFLAAGAWSLDAFVAGLSLMDGFLTNDTGPMHLAAAQGTPIVSLWGPARPGFIAPRAENLRVLYANYQCSPCVNMFTSFEGMWCGHEGWCMLEIQPQEALDAVAAMLDEAAQRRVPIAP
jgi:ADP-heptose:LPS heptosyltransferase